MTVRPFAPGDGLLWRLDARGDERTPTDADAWQQFVSAEESDERCRLLAIENDRCIGFLHVGRVDGDLFRVLRLRSAIDQDTSAVGTRLLAHLGSLFLQEDLLILSADRPSAEPLNTMMTAAGFRIERRKICVGRELQGYHSPYDDDFTYRSLVEVGEEEFVHLMVEAATGDPFEEATESNGHKQFQQLVEYAGSTFDPARWMVVYREGDPVGVMLPQIYHDEPDLGTLFYIGVLPQHRKRGYGARIHAAGLEALTRYGAARYVGSTDVRNEAMLAVFRRNECPQTSLQLFFRAPKRRDIPE